MIKPLVAITGASSGIGESMARVFSAQGHPLLLMARRAKRMEALGLPDTLCEPVDVTDATAVAVAVARAAEIYGPVDCLVLNAGVMLLGQAQSQSLDEWERMVDVNIRGVLNGIKAVLAGMVERGAGTVISVSSVAGHKPGPNLAVYSGTKFAVRAISESIREEVASHGVRISIISPGLVETELLKHSTDSEAVGVFEKARDKMGGFLDPVVVAEAALYIYRQPPEVCIREVLLAPTRQIR